MNWYLLFTKYLHYISIVLQIYCFQKCKMSSSGPLRHFNTAVQAIFRQIYYIFRLRCSIFYSFSLLLRFLFEFKNDLYVFFYFRNWSGLQFAVQQGSGGPQSAAKEAWFITVAESWFYENEDLLPCEVADFMEEILITEFDLRVCS